MERLTTIVNCIDTSFEYSVDSNYDIKYIIPYDLGGSLPEASAFLKPSAFQLNLYSYISIGQ